VTAHFVAIGVKCVLGIGIAFLVYGFLQKSLHEVLDNVIRLPEATAFYLRAFVVVLLFAVLSAAITDVNVKPDAQLMEYALEVSSGMSGVVQSLLLVLLAYVGMTTLLVVVLRPKNGK
jgi:hypothetical protein